MSDSGAQNTRLRFYGTGDYASYFQVAQAFEVLKAFDANRTEYDINDAVELSHAVTFWQRGFMPASLTETELTSVRDKIPTIQQRIGRFFGSLDESNFSTHVADIDFQYRTDVLHLLAKHKVYGRCTAETVLGTLKTGVSCDDLLTCKQLVEAYGVSPKLT